jgi:uracil-DNA glycosylase
MNFREICRKIYNCSGDGCRGCPLFKKDFESYRSVAFVGNPNAEVMIIGLNPKEHPTPPNKKDDYFEKFKDIAPESAKGFAEYFEDSKKFLYSLIENDYSYHKTFKELLSGIDSNFLENTIFIEIVKCASPKFENSEKKAIEHCGEYLLQQINCLNPKIIITNGGKIRDFFLQRFGENPEEEKKKKTIMYYKEKIPVIFSGFIGQMDHSSRVRLKREIEYIWDKSQKYK